MLEQAKAFEKDLPALANGLESGDKDALARFSALLALRQNPRPSLREHRAWAKTGLVLGILPWIMMPVILVWKWNRVLDLLRQLQELK